MNRKIHAIVLNLTKHSDRANVVNIYTRELGRLSVVSPVSSGRKARARNAGLLPLSLISCDMKVNPTKELHILGSFEMLRAHPEIYYNPIKSAVGIFVAEFLSKILRDMPPDAAIFDFLCDSLDILEISEGAEIADFHIRLLASLLSYVGLAPDLSTYRHGADFDMREGRFSSAPRTHKDIIEDPHSEIITHLEDLRFSAPSPMTLTRESRKWWLDFLLKYYAIHLPGLENLKSLPVLREIFA